MIVAFWCVLIAAVLPMLCSYTAKFGGKEVVSDDAPLRFDNHEPRAWLARQTGLRGRANAAQHNSFEAFPFFAAAVIVAVLQHVPVGTIDLCAIVFIGARLGYIVFYLADLPALRSPAFAIGFLACVALFLIAATGSLR